MRFLVLLALSLVACAAERASDVAAPLAIAPAAAREWLGAVERAHAAADAASDARAARAELEAVRVLAVPAELGGDDRRRVLQDLSFRLGVLALDAGDSKGAGAEAERGLALGHADDEFTANLWILAGRARAAQGQTNEAAAAYAAALAIHEHLFDRALQGEP
jgi:hypothetical protein